MKSPASTPTSITECYTTLPTTFLYYSYLYLSKFLVGCASQNWGWTFSAVAYCAVSLSSVDEFPLQHNYLTQWDLYLNHGQQHCIGYFSFWDCLIISLNTWGLCCVKRLTTIVKYKLNRETFVVRAASWASWIIFQGKITFIYRESNGNPVALKEFGKIFLRDQTKTSVDIVPFIPFTSFSFLSTMTVARSWIWKELKASRTNKFQACFYQSSKQDCEPPFHVRHLEAKW